MTLLNETDTVLKYYVRNEMKVFSLKKSVNVKPKYSHQPDQVSSQSLKPSKSLDLILSGIVFQSFAP